MGHIIKERYYLRGIVTYKLSPFEQRAFAGMLNPGLRNTFFRILHRSWTWGIPFGIGYWVKVSLEAKHAELNRKHPEDYENDV